MNTLYANGFPYHAIGRIPRTGATVCGLCQKEIFSMTKKQWIQYIFTILLAFGVLLAAHRYMDSRPTGNYAQADYIAMKGRVLEITDVAETSFTMSDGTVLTDRLLTFTVELLNEYREGTVVTSTQSIDSLLSYSTKEVTPGDLVMMFEYHNADGYTYVFGDYWRSDALLWLLLLFCAAVLAFGRLKGLNTLLGLAITCLFVFLVFVPSILAGCNIYVWSILTCLYSIVTTLLIIDGYSRKTLIAAAGCFGGVLTAGVLTAVMNIVMNITGLVDEQSLYLNDLSTGLTVDLRAIIFAAIIIGATGAVMDVAISVASSLHELSAQLERPTFTGLLKSGFAIGRDMMGTMANTLVLAYIGSSLATVVLIVAYNASLLSIFNKEMIVVEVEQALVGSLGILAAIPLTSLLAAWFYPLEKKKRSAR